VLAFETVPVDCVAFDEPDELQPVATQRSVATTIIGIPCKLRRPPKSSPSRLTRTLLTSERISPE
jgi:hypothetical protein